MTADEQTIFVVDDDEAIRDALCALLEARGYPVIAFAKGAELLEAYDPAWRGAILLDMKMPGLDGRAVHRALNERGAIQPVIFLTAHGDVGMAVSAMKEGAADFVEKPFDPEALLETIERTLNNGGASRLKQPRPEIFERFETLTPREREVMNLVVQGLPNKTIGFDLDSSQRTVELHRARVMHKMGARNLSRLIQMGLELGFDGERPAEG